MSEDTKKLYMTKIAAEFSLFEERKNRIDFRNDPALLKATETDSKLCKISEIEKMLEEHEPISQEAAAEMYKAYASSRRYEIYEGHFMERKKCHYCTHLTNFDLAGEKPSPCKKLNAWNKIINAHADFNDEDRNDFDKWHLECQGVYAPIIDECDVRAELKELERKQLEIISEWEAAALEKIKNKD